MIEAISNITNPYAAISFLCALVILAIIKVIPKTLLSKQSKKKSYNIFIKLINLIALTVIIISITIIILAFISRKYSGVTYQNISIIENNYNKEIQQILQKIESINSNSVYIKNDLINEIIEHVKQSDYLQAAIKLNQIPIIDNSIKNEIENKLLDLEFEVNHELSHYTNSSVNTKAVSHLSNSSRTKEPDQISNKFESGYMNLSEGRQLVANHTDHYPEQRNYYAKFSNFKFYREIYGQYINLTEKDINELIATETSGDVRYILHAVCVENIYCLSDLKSGRERSLEYKTSLFGITPNVQIPPQNTSEFLTYTKAPYYVRSNYALLSTVAHDYNYKGISHINENDIRTQADRIDPRALELSAILYQRISDDRKLITNTSFLAEVHTDLGAVYNRLGEFYKDTYLIERAFDNYRIATDYLINNDIFHHPSLCLNISSLTEDERLKNHIRLKFDELAYYINSYIFNLPESASSDPFYRSVIRCTKLLESF